jgi:predicted nucleic acid-binding protein
MNGILIDTCIWSLALRGNTPRNVSVANEVTKIIYAENARIIGPIRQEILSGYSDYKKYEQLRDKLSYFPNEVVMDVDYLCAAEFSNLCRQKGIQGSHIDFLICAVAFRLKLNIYTCDNDFLSYVKHIPIILHSES